MLPDATVRYAEHDDAVIDLHLPDEAAGRKLDQLVVLIHGGFWKQKYDRLHTRELARALADQGQLVATPEYRRAGGGGGWPTTGEDVHLAVSRLPELLGGLDLPTPTATVVTGHSAGGHLALWLATTGLAIERVVALAPVCDLQEAIRLRLGDGATQALLDGADPDPLDPMVLFADRPAAEIAIVHGSADEDVPVSLSQGLAAAHPWIDYHELPEADHFEVIASSGPVFDLVSRLLAGGGGARG